MFSSASRYANLPTYVVVDHRGRQVNVVTIAPQPEQLLLGVHRLKAGQRLDHLASLYLSDATAFWRIAEANGVMLAEALSEANDISIPRP